MVQGLELEVERGRLTLAGELDSCSARSLSAQLASMRGESITVDLSGITFIDSAGVHVLLDARRANGGMIVDAKTIPQFVGRVLDILGLRETLTVDLHEGIEPT